MTASAATAPSRELKGAETHVESGVGHDTVFSSEAFVRAWVDGLPGPHSGFPISVRGSGPARRMYAVQTPGWFGSRFGSRRIALAPAGLYASPGWDGALEMRTLVDILRQLTTFQSQTFTWNVRFDHEPLAVGLAALGFAATRNSTHVLDLVRDYDRVLAGFNSTIRNQIRKSLRRGVEVQPISSVEDIAAYYDVYKRLAQHQGYENSIYPIGLFREMAKLQDVASFLVAKHDGRVISGGVFLRDGSSVMYWSGATDRAYSSYFPACAVLDRAIRWACESNVTTFNFGGSGGIRFLEQFKSFWGAQPAENWQFTWNHPVWPALEAASKRLQDIPSELARRLKRGVQPR